MNPYLAHSQGHQQLQKLLEEPIAGVAGGYVVYAGAQYPARVSTFVTVQVLKEDGGGFRSQKVGSAIITKSMLPDGVQFSAGQFVTAVLPGGAVHECQINETGDEVTEFHLTLWDKNQNA